uniref:Uncharacterized protein n=1 Tax=Panagrolaimus davidi TaxID=227884 RepID=A0A914PN60_9BILA
MSVGQMVVGQTSYNQEKLVHFVMIKMSYIWRMATAIVVEANVAHSMPVPIHTNHVDFKVYHRSVNSIAQFNLTNSLNVNIKDLDESTTITMLKAVSEDEEEEKGRR